MSQRLLPDAEARRRIERELDINFLVEAGAGAGKTTAMVGRMVELVRTGTAPVDAIAAVTFTRKAAAELRERFQELLERKLAEAHTQQDAAALEVLDRALRNIDQGFIGTIHSFCARILREHPVEARVDPGFREISGVQEKRLRDAAWLRFIDDEALSGSSALERLEEAGLAPAQIHELYTFVAEQPDVDFPADTVVRPNPAAVRGALERLLDRSEKAMPSQEPPGGWDALQSRILAMRFYRHVLGWDDDNVFFEALVELAAAKPGVTQNRWAISGAEVKALKAAFEDFLASGGAAAELLRQWRAHRYSIALEFAKRGAAAYERARLTAGRLIFQDLLMRTAHLLRSSREARTRLASRYTHLLVDEFQDTDPVQAEIVFLLAAEDPGELDWRMAKPRPGALFVVGDPKQSIYRFRRADITVYNQVKDRFRVSGDVLELIANFRSVPAIARLVDTVFDGAHPLFARASTSHQAAFAPLCAQRGEDGGVGWYQLAPAGNQEEVAAADAEAVAAWVRNAIDAGERSAGDFMLLAHRKLYLHLYARALEAQGVPVQVTGAGIGVEEELQELVQLLTALSDPTNAVQTVAALVGLFFGLSHEDIARHAEAGGNFYFCDQQEHGDALVREALRTLHRWWSQAQAQPAEIAVAAIVRELGLLPYAAAGELGTSRAGALLFALDAIRVAGLEGDTTLTGAVEALRNALEEAEAEAPLEPGRRDAVQVMNLHKAKGLEAPVVVLIWPAGELDPDPFYHVDRDAIGNARAFLSIREQKGYAKRVIAEPLDWSAYAAAEAQYETAENVRLLYVAATRARDQLIVARCDAPKIKSPWARLHPALYKLGVAIGIPDVEVKPRVLLSATAASVADLIEEAMRARTRAGAPTFAHVSVTETAKGSAQIISGDAPRGRGREWGSAVHVALEAALRGATGAALAHACRGALRAADRPTSADGEPLELAELIQLADGMRSSEFWARALGGQRTLLEVPFAAAAAQGVGDPLAIVSGRIDLAFREDDGWVIVDYKTDNVDDTEMERRTAIYRRQVDAYAAWWQRIVQEPVKECALVFVRAAGKHDVRRWQPLTGDASIHVTGT